jgi:hypothetical protein
MRGNKYWLRGSLGILTAAVMGMLIIGATASQALAAKPKLASVVALVGATSPTPGSPTFDFPDEPMVDSQGNVVFVMFLSNFETGLFYKPKKGALQLISSTDTPLLGLGTPSSVDQAPYDGPAMSTNGIIAFVAGGLTGGSAVLRMRKKKALEVIAKTGDPAPGTTGVFDDFDHTLANTFDDLAVNKKGDVAFIATYTEDAGATFKTGVFLSTKKGIVPIVLNGDALPGTGGGTVSGTEVDDIDGPWLNDHDDVAFAVDFISAATSFEGSVFLKPAKKPLQALLLVGSALPAPVGGTLASIGIGRPGLNNQDVLAFSLESDGGSVVGAVASVSPKKAISYCALEGGAAPGTVGTFADDSSPFGNSSISGNVLVFHSDLLGDPANDNGIFACRNPTSSKRKLKPVILESSPKPTGTWGSLEEESLSPKYVVFDDESGSPEGVFIIKTP